MQAAPRRRNCPKQGRVDINCRYYCKLNINVDITSLENHTRSILIIIFSCGKPESNGQFGQISLTMITGS